MELMKDVIGVSNSHPRCKHSFVSKLSFGSNSSVPIGLI
jgi:hypothetical protein